MNKKFLWLLLFLLGASAVWLYADGSSDPTAVIKEIPVSAEQQKELKKLTDITLDLYSKKGEDGIRQLFGYSTAVLEEFRLREEVSPVDSSLEVLTQYGRNIKLADIKYTSPETSKHYFYVTGKVSGDNKLRITFAKRKKGYTIMRISEL